MDMNMDSIPCIIFLIYMDRGILSYPPPSPHNPSTWFMDGPQEYTATTSQYPDK